MESQVSSEEERSPPIIPRYDLIEHSPATTSLPPELWLAILHHSVDVPGLFDTSWDYHPDDRLWNGRVGQDTIPSDVLQTRRAITLVSRDWWRMTKRFLYEDIYINLNYAEKALAVLNRLKASGDGVTASTSEIPCGWWVKRILVIGKDPEQDDIPDVLRLLETCFHVRILHLVITCEPSSLSQLCKFLESRFARTLRRMGLRAFVFGGQGKWSWPELPLDSLAVMANVLWDPRLDVTVPPLSFHNLTVLQLLLYHFSESAHVPAWPLPSLRYLGIDGATDQSIVDSLIPFFPINGPQLLGLSLWPMHGSQLYGLLKHTTSLKTFIIIDQDLDAFHSPEKQSYPSITHLGLARPSVVMKDNIHSIMYGLYSLLPGRVFPNLQTIRLFAIRRPDILNDNWKWLISTVEQFRVRLLDRDGRVLKSEAEQSDE